jgi:hypothetical protein
LFAAGAHFATIAKLLELTYCRLTGAHLLGGRPCRPNLALLLSSVAMDHYEFPAFDELPLVEGQPQGCLWGVFDKAGVKDEAGSKSRD